MAESFDAAAPGDDGSRGAPSRAPSGRLVDTDPPQRHITALHFFPNSAGDQLGQQCIRPQTRAAKRKTPSSERQPAFNGQNLDQTDSGGDRERQKSGCSSSADGRDSRDRRHGHKGHHSPPQGGAPQGPHECSDQSPDGLSRSKQHQVVPVHQLGLPDITESPLDFAGRAAEDLLGLIARIVDETLCDRAAFGI